MWRGPPRGDFVVIDTTDILFLCGGAFTGLEQLVARRTLETSIGFGATVGSVSSVAAADQDAENKLRSRAEPADIVEFGLIPEFVGRFAAVVCTAALTEEQLMQVLTEPRHALGKQFVVNFEIDGVEFHMTDAAAREIAREARSRGTGARGLRAIMESILLDAQYELPSDDTACGVVLDEDAARRVRPPLILRGTCARFHRRRRRRRRGLELWRVIY